MQVIVIDGIAVVYSFTTGPRVKRQEEELIRAARKSPDELMRVCLWLEQHGHRDMAHALLDRYA